jgi:hypothetical protein
LREAAHGLESLAERVEERSAESIRELDSAFARSFHALALHQLETGQRSWRARHYRYAGHRLRAAADNLEAALKSSGERMNLAAEEAIRESRLVSAKLVEGSGYAVDDVGRAFERLAQQLEIVGARMEPQTSRNPDPDVTTVPK